MWRMDSGSSRLIGSVAILKLPHIPLPWKKQEHLSRLTPAGLGETTRTRHGVSLFLQVFGFCIRLLAVLYSCPHPLWMRRGAQGQTDKGKNLFERSELFLTPSGPSTAGCPQRSGGTQQPGSPFLCLLSFGEAKESELPPGNPGQQAHAGSAPPAQDPA